VRPNVRKHKISYIPPYLVEITDNQKTVVLPVIWQHNKRSANAAFCYIWEVILKQAKVLTKTEFKRVMALCEATPNGKRNKTAIMLSHYAGLRVGEIATLTWSDVLDRESQVKPIFYLKAQHTKAGEARQVHLSKTLQKQLTALHAASNPKQASKPVIQSQKGGAFSANSLCQLFKRIYDNAGIDDASSHSGRRWFITKLAHSGVSPKVIMELAGHKQLTTTQRYIHVNDRMKAAAVELL
jgi:integrase/recombinase XerD